MSQSVTQSVYLSVCLSVCPSDRLSVRLSRSDCLSVPRPSVSPSIRLSVRLYVCQCVCLFVCLSVPLWRFGSDLIAADSVHFSCKFGASCRPALLFLHASVSHLFSCAALCKEEPIPTFDSMTLAWHLHGLMQKCAAKSRIQKYLKRGGWPSMRLHDATKTI